MVNRKVNEWAPLVGGAMMVFILFVGILKAFNVNNGGQYSSFLPATEGHAKTEGAMSFRRTSPSPPSSSLLSPPFPASTTQASSSFSLPSPSPASTTRASPPFTIMESLPQEYRLGRMSSQDWDVERQRWLATHPHQQNFTHSGKPRLFMLTGSQPQPCHGAKGDYLMLKSLKNKIDYCMFHGVQIFYNMAILDKNMDGFWSKLPLIRASMEAHPEAEWFWWVDSDVVITDMLFEIPLHTYAQYNLVVHGWEIEVFDKKSVMGLNAGSFLLRNCGWSFKFMDRWASMGPKGPIRDLAGRLQSALLHNRPPDYPGDDQAALIYFMILEHDVWGDKILLERQYNLNGYWLDMVGNMERIEMEERHSTNGKSGNLSRSFVTHFSGCQPCTGNRNPAFEEQRCRHEMERALNLADNQVLHSLGFRHPNLNSLDVEPLP